MYNAEYQKQYYQLHKEQRKQYLKEHRKKAKEMKLARRNILLPKKVMNTEEQNILSECSYGLKSVFASPLTIVDATMVASTIRLDEELNEEYELFKQNYTK